MSARGGLTWALPLASVLVLAGCSSTDESAPADVVPDDIAADGTLLVATDPTFPPAEFRAPVEFQGVQRGEVTGFEADLVEAVADELGLDVEWVDLPFDEVLDEVSSGGADVGAAAISVTPERADDFTFVTFYETGTQWAARDPNQAGVSPNDACGARVAVQAGTVQAADLVERSTACEEAGDEAIDITEYERQDEATAAVLAGVANAFVADAPAVQWAIQQTGGSPNAASTVNTGRLVAVGESYDNQPYGWAVADPDLAEALLEGLQSLVSSGDYADILEFWNVEDGALDSGAIAVFEGG